MDQTPIPADNDFDIMIDLELDDEAPDEHTAPRYLTLSDHRGVRRRVRLDREQDDAAEEPETQNTTLDSLL